MVKYEENYLSKCTLLVLKWKFTRRTFRYHDCCCHGSSGCKFISSHDIDYEGVTSPCLFQGCVSRYSAISVSRNKRKSDFWSPLTHWGRVTHICVGKLTIIASDNGLSPGRRQAIIWTNDGILVCGPLGTNFIEILIGIKTFSFKKMHSKMSSAKWRPFCLGLNVLNTPYLVIMGEF